VKNRFQIVLAYDGTEFHGSQFQPELRTVQGELERVLPRLGWQGKSVIFAGRTDAGVHAAGQVIAFDLDWNHTEKELQKAINAVLPPDISAVKVHRTEDDFHPRFNALSREYHYQILNSPLRDPLRERYLWRVWPAADLRKMKAASRLLIGTHDFAAFGRAHQSGGTTIREIHRAAWKKKGNQLVFELEGNAFLYHMVRHIVMVLVKIGQGLEPVDQIKQYLDDPKGLEAQGLAPAQGLSLARVKYQN
jgi:tRNA pseudouridine38-40 synthase